MAAQKQNAGSVPALILKRILRRCDLLRFDLLSEQVAAEGHAAVESNGGEVGATAGFPLDPGANRWSNATNGRLQRVEHAEVDADGPNLAAVLRPVGAQQEELDNPMEVLARGRGRKSGDILDLGRKNMVRRRGEQRSAIRY